MKDLNQPEVLPAANARYANICLLVSESDGTERWLLVLRCGVPKRRGAMSPKSDLLWLNIPDIK